MELRRSTSCGLRGHGCSRGISVVAIVTALLMLAAAVRTGRALYRRMELSGASNDNDAWRRRLPEGFHGVATLLLLPMRSWKDFIIARLLSVRWRWLCETIQLGLWIAVLVFSVAEIVMLCWPMLDHVANGQMPAAALSLTHGSSLVQTPQSAPPNRLNLPSAAKISSAARGRIQRLAAHDTLNGGRRAEKAAGKNAKYKKHAARRGDSGTQRAVAQFSTGRRCGNWQCTGRLWGSGFAAAPHSKPAGVA